MLDDWNNGRLGTSLNQTQHDPATPLRQRVGLQRELLKDSILFFE
jgi:hypothetical protein